MDSDDDTQMMDAESIAPFTSAEKGKGKVTQNGSGAAYEDDNLPWFVHWYVSPFQS